MRVLPAMMTSGNFVNTSKYLTNMRNNSLNNIQPRREANHQYTGVASADLAYASLFDQEIARDLKLMGLI